MGKDGQVWVCVYVLFCSVMSDSFVTLWTVARQAPLFMGFSRQGHWSGLPFPSPRDLPDPGIKPKPPALQADSFLSEPPAFPKSCKKKKKKKKLCKKGFGQPVVNQQIGSQTLLTLSTSLPDLQLAKRNAEPEDQEVSGCSHRNQYPGHKTGWRKKEHEAQGNEEDIQPYSNPYPMQSLYAKVVLTHPQGYPSRIAGNMGYYMKTSSFFSMDNLFEINKQKYF